jgi:chaperonin GroES
MIGFKKLSPLLNRVLVKKAEPAKKSAGGILLQSGDKNALNWGVVIDVGPGKAGENGKVVPVLVKVGDHVLLPEWGGAEVELAGDNKLHIYRDDDIVGVLSEKVQ